MKGTQGIIADFLAEGGDESVFYPGSKTPRAIPPVELVDDLEDHWSANPIERTIRGRKMQFYGIGSLAKALNRSVVSVRLWERLGYIPTAPYRTPDHKGGKGRRLYSRSIIEATVEEFDRRGLLPAGTHVKWTGKHQDLTFALVERWRALVEIEKNK